MAFEYTNVLEIQGISCKKTDNFLPFWVPCESKSALTKGQKDWMCDNIEFFLKKYIHVQICSFCGLLQVR